MYTVNLTEEQRLQKAVGRIMHEPRYTALAGIIMIGKRTVCDKTPTASTDGRDEKYGREFIRELRDSELRFVVIHECYHKMYRHLITWRHLWKENPRIANAAMDYVINFKIDAENKDGFCTIPKNPDGSVKGLLDQKYKDMDTAQVYALLKKDQKEQDSGDGSGSGSGGTSGSAEDSGGTSGSAEDSGGDSGSSSGGFDEHDWDGAKEMDAQEARELAKEIDNAIRQGAMMAGKMNLSEQLALQELLKVQVDWREVLRDFITTTCAGKDYSTWRRPNRRFMSAGVYMPSAISERVDELVIAVDTSGSIGSKELASFLSEVKGICDHVKPEKIRLLYWGSSVVGDETYDEHTRDQLVNSTKPKGGGGTDVECVPAYMKKHNINPQAVICLTDGYLYGGWGQWSVPVLWTIMDNESATPDCGKTVHITARDL